MGKIFISYRWDDAADSAARLSDFIRANVKDGDTFLDIAKLLPGDDIEQSIAASLKDCTLFLAVIGKSCLDARNDRGERRLDAQNDPVRAEIRAALTSGIRVVPVLVGGACMPNEAELPDDIRAFAKKLGVEVRHQSFERDASHLFASFGL